ncbi:hypothetical protein N7470_009931 [Penicillium chermesinum]|nr:hypothetical protein N7470_009931 [Penicillium chermesinum]
MATMRARHKIRAPRRGLVSSQVDDFESIWATLASSLNEIFTRNASQLSFEQLYRNAYKVVLMMKGQELYDRVKELIGNWLRENVQKTVINSIIPILLQAHTAQASSEVYDQTNERREAGEKFLGVLTEAWENHQLCMGMITDVLMYMDRIIAVDQSKPSINVVAMTLFRDHVLRAKVRPDEPTTVSDLLESTILFTIQQERAGHVINRMLIRHCIQMLEGLYENVGADQNSKLYLSTFEPAFLQHSREFYEAEAQRLLEVGDAATFCKTASQRIIEEQERARTTLSLLTEPKILAVVDEVLILRHIDEVVQLEGTGVVHMLDQNQMDGLHNVYMLNARVDNKKEALTKVVSKKIVELGQEINASSFAPQPPAQPAEKDADGKKSKEKPVNQQTVSAIQWVDDILALKERFDNVWRNAFQSDQGLQSSIEASFAAFINLKPRSSEFFEVDALLDNGITLLRYIKDKDLFETYYKKHLSRRLLMKRSVSMDAERQMISKMKMEVGNQFTQRIESMFKDMAVSEDLTASYKEHIARSADPDQKPIDLEINVLTSTMWPMEIMSNANDRTLASPTIFPREIESVKQSFEKFYLGKHSGRKLSWQSSMGTADVRATFVRSNGKVQRYELNVSTYMLIILLPI